MKHEPLLPTWPERYFTDRAASGNLIPLPPRWNELEREAAAARMMSVIGAHPYPPKGWNAGPLKSWFARGPGTVDISYPQGFFCLNSVSTFIGRTLKMYERNREALRQHYGENSKWNMQQTPFDIAFVELYTSYSARRWEHYGKRVFLIDDHTFELFANTELPQMPLRYLTAPVPTFWLQFPKDTYRFITDFDLAENSIRKGVIEGEAPDPSLKSVQTVDGVMVSFSNPDVDDTPKRQITMLVGGRSSEGPHDDNVVFFNEDLDDRPISDLWRAPEDTGLIAGNAEIGVLTPRAVLNFLLYMMSEQPYLEPVPPVKRNKFADIRSPVQREKALQRQEEKLARLSKVGYVYVGRPPAVPVPHVPREDGRRWKLDRRVWVPGHWKFQAHGPRHSLRKLKHIEPYWKGPDVLSATAVRRVQPAKEV